MQKTQGKKEINYNTGNINNLTNIEIQKMKLILKF